MAIINKKKFNRLKQKANDLLNRTLDQHVTLAVTGLSRSGKTAFITSLVNQLVNEGSNSQLGFFNVVHQGRFIAAKRVPQNIYILVALSMTEQWLLFLKLNRHGLNLRTVLVKCD